MKCGIRRADEVAPLTDSGTLIMRRGPYSERVSGTAGKLDSYPAASASTVNETLRCSIAPFSVEIDADELEDPAGIGDALGERFTTMRTDNGERSRFAGIVAGLFSLGIGIAIGYASLTEAYLPLAHSMSAGRARNEVAADLASFDRTAPEDAESRAVVKPKVRKKRVVIDDAPATELGAEASQPSDSP